MNGNFLGSLVTVLTAVLGVAIVAVLVSKNAQTPEVIKEFSTGFSSILGAATAPVSGSSLSHF